MIEGLGIYSGISIFNTPVFVFVDFIAFFLSIILMLRIGSGELLKPVLFFGLSFLVSGVIPLIFGMEYIWVIPLIQTFLSFVGILILMKILGVFEMISSREKPNEDQS